MSKNVLFIKGVDDSFYWDYGEWETYLPEDFKDSVVVIGNRDVEGIAEATWYKDAISLIYDIDNNYMDLEEFKSRWDDQFAEDKLEDIFEACADCDNCEDPDFIAKVCNILYPWLNFSTTTIRGSVQREWAETIYVDGAIDMNIFEDWYFGNIYDIVDYTFDESDFADDEYAMELLQSGDYETLIDEGYLESEGTCPITSTEYYRLDRKDIKTGLAEYLGIPVDSIVAVVEKSY